MNKTLTILKHEFTQTITRKGFITMTVLFPLVGLAAIGIFLLTQAGGPAEVEAPRVGYLDETGDFGGYSGEYGGIILVPCETGEAATAGIVSGDIDEYFVIPEAYLESGLIARYHTEKELEINSQTYGAIRSFLLDNLLKGQASPELAERIKNPVNVQNIRLDETGQVASDQGGFGTFILPAIFGFLLIASIGSSSGYLLQGVGEEKENRIMEVLLSSVSARQMLVGKVFGLGGAGLVQIVVWLLSAVFIMRLGSDTIGGFFSTIVVPDNFILLGIVYFILGYLFFAVVMAGIGAITANPKEGSQLSVILILPAILPF